MTMAPTYFERVAADRFRPTARTSGAWNAGEQHVAPALGLLVHLVETDRDGRRTDGLTARLLLLGAAPSGRAAVGCGPVTPGF